MSIGILALAIVVLLVAPAFAAFSTFLIVLRYWNLQLLKNERELPKKINLSVVEGNLSWDLENRELPWPTIPLEWATVAAMSVILIATTLLGRESELQIFWFIAGVATAAMALVAQFFFSVVCKQRIYRLIRADLFALVSPRLNAETEIIRRIVLIGRDISDCFVSMGIVTQIDTSKICGNILIWRAKQRAKDALGKLIAAEQSLTTYLEELRYWAHSYDEARREFEWTKNAVISSGSATLVDEIDRIRAWMGSECLAEHLDRGRWDKAQELIDRIRFDLKMIRNVAEGGSEIPQSFDEACRLLNVSRTTPKKVVKAVVDALRRVWHPDLSCNPNELEQRTARIQQINTAWEIILASLTVDELRPTADAKNEPFLPENHIRA